MTPDPDQVEIIIAELQRGLANCQWQAGPEVMTAVMTFAFRFGKAMLLLTPKDKRVEQARIMANGFQKAGAMLEFEVREEAKEQVH